MILVISPKNVYITGRLKEEAARVGMALAVFDIKELAEKNFEIDIEPFNVLYVRFCFPYFEETINLARRFIAAGKIVIDASIANGEVGEGKMWGYERMRKANLPIPETRWLKNFQFSIFNFQSESTDKLSFVVKWNYGFKGKGFSIVKNRDDFDRAISILPKEELLVQEFIPAEFEYKIITVGYKALPVIVRWSINPQTHKPEFKKSEIIRLPPEGAPPGEEKYGVMEVSQKAPFWDLARIAEQAAKATKKELAKVDVMQAGGKFYILEVNRWPGLKSYEALTGFNAVGEFIRYLSVKEQAVVKSKQKIVI